MAELAYAAASKAVWCGFESRWGYMGVDGKYGRVTLEHGTIGEHEPVVVFRAQDQLLPLVLQAYRELCVKAGSPQRHLDLIDRTVDEVLVWQAQNPFKVPSSDSLQ